MAVTALVELLWPGLARFWSYGALAAVSLLAWHFDARAVANADTAREQAASFKQAQATATVIAQQALQHEQAQYLTKATEADNAYQTRLAAAQSAVDRYVVTRGMHAQAVASGASATITAAQSDSAGISANVPTDSLVVSASDLQICNDAVTYALGAHDWANSINP